MIVVLTLPRLSDITILMVHITNCYIFPYDNYVTKSFDQIFRPIGTERTK